MLRKESEAVPEGNGPVPQQEEFGSGQPTLEDVYRIMKEVFEEWDTKMDKLLREYREEWRSIDQRLTRLEHDARQPRHGMEADGPANTKTRERTEGANTTGYKRCMGIAFLLAGLIPARSPTRPVSA